MIEQLNIILKFSFQICENEFQSWTILQYVHLEPIRTGMGTTFENSCHFVDIHL